MNNKKIGTERNIVNKCMKLKFGAVDKKSPKVIYFEGGMYITPQTAEKSYKNAINNIYTSFYSFGKDFAERNDLSTNFIIDFQTADERMIKGKSSFLSFQYFFKQKEVKSYNIISKTLSNDFKKSISKLLDSVVSNNFSYSKTKC